MDFRATEFARAFSPPSNQVDWTTTQIRGSEKGTVLRLWVVTGTMVIMGGVFIWNTHQGFFIAKNVPNIFLCILAPLTFFLLAKATWETVRLKRFGDPMLELNAAPIPAGEKVEGRITLALNGQAPDFELTLACIHRVVTGTDKNSKVTETVLWSTLEKASLLLGGILPVSIATSKEQPQTNSDNPSDRILWRLTVKAPFHGPAFLENYELPVGRAPETIS
jgi:hypothetical protein